ncbi:MAG: hypothetical protein M3Y59_01010, partial [Myxococcota bacterium]|nr:hypothetical protein [Myxococcota bacterium]
VMDGRLRATLGGGVQQAAAKLQAIIPGRGLDPAFIQNVTAGYLELGAEYELAAMEASALTIGASYSALPTAARFHALGTWTDTRALGHAANATLGYRRELGPGESGVQLRFSLGGAALGPLSEVGTSRLTSLSLSLSYSFAFTPRGATP